MEKDIPTFFQETDYNNRKALTYSQVYELI